MKKTIGYIGLGKMGYNMVERLTNSGFKIIAYDKDTELTKKVSEIGVEVAADIPTLVNSLGEEKLIWIMVPHAIVDNVLTEIKPLLKSGDTVIDGGNSPFKESIRRGKEMESLGINFLDIGVSGGPGGAKEGACLMIGGDGNTFKKNIPLFEAIASKDAYAYLGKSGAGHFSKMIHNGIEYGMMQAIGEGFGILKKSDFDLNLSEVARIYNNKSVIESRLVGWLEGAFKTYGESLEEVSGEVQGTGEGKWTVETGEGLGVQVPVIKASVEFRNNSKGNPSYVGKVVSALRNQFGGHSIGK